MLIKIETPTDANPKTVFNYFKEKCNESLQEFTLEVGELKFQQEKKIPIIPKEVKKEKSQKQERLEKKK